MEFQGFPKLARWSREIIVTEKIDGTNACILIGDAGEFLTGSRTRWITPADDNFGFSRWAHEHKDELMQLGPGRHFGEWWGAGIQRKYGLIEKRFSLFNASRWCAHDSQPKEIVGADPRIVKHQERVPACCGVVPVLYQGSMDPEGIDQSMRYLNECGSRAAPGFRDPEGIVIFHVAAGVGFKKTRKKDGEPKSLRDKAA